MLYFFFLNLYFYFGFRSANVKILNANRPRFEELKEREDDLSPEEKKEIETLRAKLNHIWGGIVLTEVYLFN